jgi:hypothetical protein
MHLYWAGPQVIGEDGVLIPKSKQRTLGAQRRGLETLAVL